MQSIEELKKKAGDAQLRGKAITFNDGKEYVIPTRLMRGENPRLKEIREKAEKADNITEEDIAEFVDLAVRINYPDAKEADIVADVECMREVLKQYCGLNVKK